MFANSYSTDSTRAMVACPYKNIGQRAEYLHALELTGKACKASNARGGADVLTYQVKTFRATVCKGSDLDNFFTEYADAARVAFVDEENALWYDLSKEEFRAFIGLFAEPDNESHKNGSTPKFRLNRQYKAQRNWLRCKT